MAIVVLAILAFSDYRGQKRAGVAVDGEMIALRTLLIGQAVLLVDLICNNYRGVPLPAVIFGTVAAII